MWSDPQNDLNDFVKFSNTLKIDSLVIAEWNMNSFATISNYGTYRFRPATSDSKYFKPSDTYTLIDEETNDFFTNANKSVSVFKDFINENDEVIFFEEDEVKRSLYYDLKKCFDPFRPRSGINKPLYLNSYIDNVKSAKKPRYYMASRYDNFKYWNSYRTQLNDTRGRLKYTVSSKQLTNQVATLTIGSHNLVVGDSIDVYSVDDLLNGTFTITSKTSNTVSYAVESASTINTTAVAGSLYLDVKITEYGVSFATNPTGYNNSIGYIIEDTAPFVVYDEKFAANRIVVKMQTNMSDVDDTELYVSTYGIEKTNPFTDIDQSSIPKRWKIQYLDEANNWKNAISFNENSTRVDGSPIVPWDGHVEISYGISFPDEFKQSFKLIGSMSSSASLPNSNINQNGDAYVVGETSSDPGQLYIWKTTIGDWIKQTVKYQFSLVETDDSKNIGIVNNIVDPPYTVINNEIIYKEIVFIKGLRVVIETMYAPDKTFDLIELSPRIRANVSKYVDSFTFSKNISNDTTGLPVGGLLASTGNISIMNYDDSFTENNVLVGTNGEIFKNINASKIPVTGSLVSQYLKINVKFDFYEIILNVNGYDKYIPIKTMYAEQFPMFSGGMSSISVSLRDLFFRFETTRATPMFFTQISLTSAVALLLDSVGFSNYAFIGFDDKVLSTDNSIEFYRSLEDPVIPYFFVHPDVNVSQALIDLATSFQVAMFFDEYNNFILMPKEHMLPASGARYTNAILYGNSNAEDAGIALPNIIDINGADSKILNDGLIQYTTRYIQKDISSLQQARYVDQDRYYNYKPVLLWEVGSNAMTKTINQSSQSSNGSALSAVPLNTTLSSSSPSFDVATRTITNNTIDVGENAMWLGKFQGYLYSNGEIIRYDAVEYNIPLEEVGLTTVDNKVWISSNQEYQKYFSSLKFGGRIYPTGLLRIYSEPIYETIFTTSASAGELQYKGMRHGRGQFGTKIVEHQAGLSSYWSNDANVKCCKMDSSKIFTTTPTANITYPAFGTVSATSSAGVVTDLAKSTTRNGIIKNFMRATLPSDEDVRKMTTAGNATLQSSALVFNGVQNSASAGSSATDLYPNNSNKRDYIFYVHKQLDSQYTHFGSRLRILGKTKVGDSFQIPRGSFEYFNLAASDSNARVSIEGGSAGIAFNLNPLTNIGYYFELTTLTYDNLQDYQLINQDTRAEVSVLHNINFYKIMPSSSGNSAIPKKLWGGLAQLIVDEGLFTGMDRIGVETPTVYDIAVEYENVGSKRVFYLYVNNSLLDIVEDASPLPEYNNMGLFIRGSTEAMFENIYALQSLISKNIGETIVSQVSDAFGIDQVSSISALRKYGMSGIIQASYLSGISADTPNTFKIYFDEFGTILRECMYFNIRYDKAYPAIIAEIAPTASQDRGYTVSGFKSGSYGAEFMIFNNADRPIALDETTGNYLRILGIAFTQDTSQELTVDSYLNKVSNFSDPEQSLIDSNISSMLQTKKKYESIETSRQRNGKKQFSINPVYIQDEDSANGMMKWLIDKTLRERKTFNIQAFGVPHIQLGDIVSIDYTLPIGVKIVDSSKQFIVSSINYSRSSNDISVELKVTEI
jgi:hypothetical protein